jgi:hypothetical protein
MRDGGCGEREREGGGKDRMKIEYEGSNMNEKIEWLWDCEWGRMRRMGIGMNTRWYGYENETKDSMNLINTKKRWNMRERRRERREEKEKERTGEKEKGKEEVYTEE